MLEYFSYRKFKKHKDAKDAGAQEVLAKNDEKYFEGLVDSPDTQEVVLQASSGDSVTTASASPSEAATPATSEAGAAVAKKHTWKDTVSEYANDTYEKARQVKVAERLPAFLQRRTTPPKEDKGKAKATDEVPTSPKKDKKTKEKKEKTKEQEEYLASLSPEERELHEALDALSLAAQDGKAFSLSDETRSILKDFTQILKDTVNGVPTAYDDMFNLFETKSKQIEGIFEDTPSFVKKLAKQIPDALGLGEKALAGAETAAAGSGPGALAAQAASLGIPTLKQLVTKPNAVANALKTVVNAIKLRFPGIALGTNVVLSMALFVLLFVFWYCYKRGKEVRLEKERLEREAEEEAIAKSILEEAPPVPTTDPATSVQTTTNTVIDEVIDPVPTPATTSTATAAAASTDAPKPATQS